MENTKPQFILYSKASFPPAQGRRPDKPSITFTRSGVVWISKAAAALLSLSEGDLVELLRDRDRSTDWFICRSCRDDAFRVRASSTRNPRLCIRSRPLCQAVLDALGEAGPVRMGVAGRPMEDGSDIHALLWRKGEGNAARGGKRWKQ